MTDVDQHLEKMGSELKCPVCLSLLKSAVSLTCNHIFCGSCISGSMKLGLSCPVCKVPFRRREVRPAHQIDSLVSIYRKMEIAAGVSIHTTQPASLVKHSDEAFHGEQEPNSFMPEANKNCKRKAKRKPMCKKGNKQLLEENSILEHNSRFSMLPSIPTNKRVNVAPYPISETPLQPKKVIGPVDRCCRISVESDINLKELHDKPTLSKKESGSRGKVSPALSPFFWLREENESNEEEGHTSSQQTSDIDISLPQVPCFSDLKDSDASTPVKTTPMSKSHADQIFDSEIFEWTQRLCSPELCSTPVKHETVDTHGSGNETVVQSEMVSETQLGANAMMHQVGGRKRKNMKQGAGLSCKMQRINTGNGSSTRGINAMKDANENSDMFEHPNPIDTNAEIDRKSSRKKRSIVGKLSACSSKRNSMKRRNKVNVNEKEEQYDKVPWQMLDAEVQNECTFNKKRLLPTNCHEKKEMGDSIYEGVENDEICGKNSRKSWEKCLKVTSSAASADIIEVTPSPCQDVLMLDQNTGIHLPFSLCHKDKDIQDTKTAGRSQKNTKTGTCVQNTRVKQHNKKNRIIKHCHHHTSLLKDEANNEALSDKDDCVRVAMECSAPQKKQMRKVEQKEKNSKNENFMIAKEQNKTPSVRIAERMDGVSSNLRKEPGHTDLEDSERPVEIVGTVEQHCLKKCDRISSQIRCEFCKSSEETEISGKMMHYFKCKPVASDYNGGTNVVHTHKHCTEWAPNVYFENEVAINLTAELARSKRIKCCCCGIKGAALGCFEKSCRKSYHFTCAKFVPECWWDTEKFVMLCPLHASSRLPCEVSPTEKKRKGTIKSKRYPKGLAVNKLDISTGRQLKSSGEARNELEARTIRQWKWPNNSPYKWVLCCSALNASAKETISEFTTLTGMSVSKTWAPNVTHVIASTDDKGACRRTFKVLMGIIEGKWILKIDWLKACISKMEPVEEEQFEINMDNHGFTGGPRAGRLRVIKKEPKLFCGLDFYFMGDFTASYKGYLQELVTAAGGTVLQRRPIYSESLFGGTPRSGTYIIHGTEQPENIQSGREHEIFIQRQNEAKIVANNSGAKLATNTWLLDSIVACTSLPEY